jgi:LEA14-like dessication related protein
MKRALLIVTALALVGGCATLNSLIQKPTLDFKSASLSDVSLGGATVNLVYTVTNPNPIGVKLAEIDYALQVDGHPVTSGQPPKGLEIAANGSSEVTFPAHVQFADLGKALAQLLNEDSAKYKASGHLGIDTPIGLVSLPLEKEGTFELPKIPQLAFASPQVTDVSFTGATVKLPIAVTNRGGLPIPIGGFGGHVLFGGKTVGTISSGQLGLLAAHATQNVSLPITIHFADAGLALAQALRGGGSSQLTFDGQLQSGGAAVPLSVKQLVQFVH